MKNKIKKPIYKDKVNIGYPESEAVIYDQRRFSDPKGKLFNKLELHQLERILYSLPNNEY